VASFVNHFIGQCDCINSHDFKCTCGHKIWSAIASFLRLSFGIQGAVLASLLRALVACGWFGIQTWIGGAAIYQLLLTMFPSLANATYLGNFIGLNAAQAICFLFFWIH
jgi:cytosine/uracil/thiamine/allantoin permease